MFELFENLTNWLWGLPLLITILATGVYLTVRSGFFQFRHFGYIVKNMFSKERCQEGGDDGKSLTPFQAISIAIGGTVGVSNMSGVATAIATGGPGALFWLWIAALLAMVIKMAEVTLAVYYREKQPNGEYQGGPTYYMQKGLGGEKKLPFWKLFAVLFGGCIFHDMVHYLTELYSIRGCRKYLPPAVHRTVTFVCGSDLSDHHRRCKESRRDLFLYDTDHVHALHCRISCNTGSEF